MREYLSRNFIIIENNPRLYQKVLFEKLQKIEKQFDYENFKLLFDKLNDYHNDDDSKFIKVADKLKIFTEDFIIENAFYINWLLKLTSEERKIIMLKFNYFQYSDDLNVFNFLQEFINNFKNTIYDLLNDFVNINYYNKNKLMEKAINLKNDQDKEFIGNIFVNFLNKYPAINEIPNFSKLFLNLMSQVGTITYNYLIDNINSQEKFQNCIYSDYSSDMLIRMIKRKNWGSPKIRQL